MLRLIRQTVQEDENVSTDVISSEIDPVNEIIGTNTAPITTFAENTTK